MYNIFKYLLLVLLCLMIGGDGEELAAAAGNTKTKTKIPPILPDDPLDLPPLFQDDFESIVEVKNLETKETYMIHEKVKRDSVWLQMNKSSDKKLRTCTYSKLSGFGHTIYGLECLPAVNLPSGCFCSSGPIPSPYLPLTDLLSLVAKKGVNRSQVVLDVRKEFHTWKVAEDNIDLTAAFVNDLNYNQEAQNNNSDDGKSGENTKKKGSTEQRLIPFSIHLVYNSSNPNYFTNRERSCGNVKLDYIIHTWQSPSKVTENQDPSEDASHNFGLRPPRSGGGGGVAIKNDWTIAPEGVFCQRPDIFRKKLPNIPDHFSVKIETVDETQKAVTFSEEHYDFSQKLVSFQFAPRSHSPPAIFFARFVINPGYPNDLYRVVYDFASDVQYNLNERTGNCSVRAIPASISIQLSEGDTYVRRRRKRDENTVLINTKENNKEPEQTSIVGTFRHVRLRHAKELLSVEPQKFVYSGSRSIRGIPCDVWVAEVSPEDSSNTKVEGKTEADSKYKTVELYFSRPDWHILVEEINSLSQLPLGMRTYIADSKNSTKFDNKITSHYYEFNPSNPMWKNFDVTSCLAQFDKLYLKITLDVSYTLLVQFSLQKAHDSIRKAIASISGISPLRIAHLHLSTAPGDKEAIDVWFVMLDRAKISRMYDAQSHKYSSKRILSISEAYRNLAQLISQRDIPLKLPLNKEREVVARLRKHSLQVAPESVYPSTIRRGSYRFLRASYTAGSMAGLGFSMAILGICIGIFLGFLLWKRRLGLIPYYLTSP